MLLRAFVVATTLLLPVAARAQEEVAPIVAVATNDDDADARRLNDILQRGAGGAKTVRLTGAWTMFGLGIAEVATGAILLGTLKDDPLRTIMPAELFFTGGLTLALTLPSFLVRSQMEKLAERSGKDLSEPGIPVKQRVVTAVGGLRTAADAEESQRILQIVGGSLGLALAAGGEVFVFAVNGLTNDYRAGFGTAFAVLGALDLALLIDIILSRPVGRALEEWDGVHPKSAFRVMPVVGPTSLGLAGVF